MSTVNPIIPIFPVYSAARIGVAQEKEARYMLAHNIEMAFRLFNGFITGGTTSPITPPVIVNVPINLLSPPTGPLGMNNKRIVDLADPVDPQDALTLSYGETLISGAISDSVDIVVENVDAVTLLKGMAVMTGPSGIGCIRWDGTRQCLGLISVGAAPTYSVTVQIISGLTISDWTSITGSSTLGTGPLFADPSNPGKLTGIPPTSGVLQFVGQPISSAELEIIIGDPVLL